MRMIITATVTYEIDDVASFEDATDVLRQIVTSEAQHMDGVTHTGTRDVFASEVNDDGTIISNPTIWELEEML